MIKILIIEDEPSISEMYKFRLEQAGFTAEIAHNGVEGVKLAQEIRPALILLDIMMPEMNGDIALAKIRETDWGSQIRVIVLTNISKDEAPSSLKFMNVNRYIVKASYTPSEVINVVNDVLIRTNVDHTADPKK
jgi:DNA-binding response OmpR family regulator